MSSFYTEEELKKIGFKSMGENVLVSKKASIYGPERISLGNNVRIDDFTFLSGNIQIDDYVHISAYSSLVAGNQLIHMKDFSGLSSRVTVYAVSDDYSGKHLTNPTVPNEYKCIYGKDIIFEKHSIIGTNSVILPGAYIAEGVSIGAMSLLTKETEAWGIYAGIPAKRIKNRDRTLLELIKKLNLNDHIIDNKE